MSTVFLNGQFVSAEEARVSAWDGGWLHGAGLFETMRASQGRIFRLNAHLDRLAASAQKLLFPLERPDLPLTSDFEELLSRNGLADRGSADPARTDARVRLTVTAGTMLETVSGGSGTADDRPKLTACVTAARLTFYPSEVLERGMTVVISPYKTSPDDPIAGHKCTAYLPRLLALRDAHAKHAGEALWFTTSNLLAEGSISNVFVVRQGRLCTPPRETPVLPGITRAAVLELALAAGLDTAEKPLTINDLLDADEVFLTNTIMGVMPVGRVERREIGNGKPGELTRRLRADYLDLVERECKAHA